MDRGRTGTVPGTRQSRIALIVDDDPGSIHMVSTALEESGTTVLVARDGATALDLVGRIQPDVILLDAMMPGLDGFETCRRLRAPPIRTAAPIIFMTGLGETEHILCGLRAGCVDYVTKPVQLDELIARVATHIINAQLMDSARHALDADGRAIAAFTPDGGLSWASPNAERLMADAGLNRANASDFEHELIRWLSETRLQSVSRAVSFNKDDLQFTLIGMTQSGESLVRLSAEEPADRIGKLVAEFGLTPREAEVLLWLTQGKTNRDIGEILDLSNRTINKHLEQVFAKMGVDNRTAAAITASRSLWL